MIIEHEVLENIRPGPLPEEITKTIEKVKKAFKGIDVMLGGSTAKNTNLKGDHDIDVFIRFDNVASMSDATEAGLKNVFKNVERVHGSRDYFQVEQNEWFFEFVPVKKIETYHEAENVTDVSPLHVAYVKDRLSEEQADQVRLLKQFCKATSVYGAESYIGGFSGHVIELLILSYGTFRDVLHAAKDWESGITLDPGNHKSEIHPSKAGPLIIIDPVQPERNAAAALTEQTFNTFKEKATDYLKAEDPTNFFTIIPLSEETFRELHPKDKIISIHIKPLPGKLDVIAAKCYKVVQHISRLLSEHGFKIRGTAWEFNHETTLALFAVPAGLLPEEEVLQGPPETKEEEVKKFQEKHKNTYVEDGKWYAKRTRKIRDPIDLIKAHTEDVYITLRVQELQVRT